MKILRKNYHCRRSSLTMISGDNNNDDDNDNIKHDWTLTSTTDLRQMHRQAKYWGLRTPLHPFWLCP